MDPMHMVPAAWRARLAAAAGDPEFAKTIERVERARERETVYPTPDRVFAALDLTPPDSIRVVILGQDPYPGVGQANGLAFSVGPGVAIPGSLRNILISIDPELRKERPTNGSLEPWARQGVLLLNTILTVRAGHAGSHRRLGWQRFTDAVIRSVNDSRRPVIFLLWGRYAQAKSSLVTGTQHVVLKTSHPSPYSARLGFLKDRPLIAANKELSRLRLPEIDWTLPQP